VRKLYCIEPQLFLLQKILPWAFEILNELGISHDASIFPSKHDYGGFPEFGNSQPSIIETNGIQIKEFPMNTYKFLNKTIVFSGGGFFRLFPYDLIKKWTADSDYVMTYFHPRDFDKGQPMLQHLPLLRKFKSYYGLKSAGPKFEKYISDFNTTSILNVSKNFDWASAKKHEINKTLLNNTNCFIHLAGKAHDLKKTSEDKEYYEANTELTKRLFNQFLESDCEVFIYMSSVKAVADVVQGVLTEDVIPNPITVYGKSKLAAEEYILSKKYQK
jgi:hypothetical protein